MIKGYMFRDHSEINILIKLVFEFPERLGNKLLPKELSQKEP